jgi:hypothetical protein
VVEGNHNLFPEIQGGEGDEDHLGFSREGDTSLSVLVQRLEVTRVWISKERENHQREEREYVRFAMIRTRAW